MREKNSRQRENHSQKFYYRAKQASYLWHVLLTYCFIKNFKIMQKLKLNKEFITSLDKFEMTHVRGGDANTGYGVEMNGDGNLDKGPFGWISLVASTVGTAATTATGGIMIGLMCAVLDEHPLTDAGCNSGICGS